MLLGFNSFSFTTTEAWAQPGVGDGDRNLTITVQTETPGVHVVGPIDQGFGEGVRAYLLHFTPQNPGDPLPANADVEVNIQPDTGWTLETPDANSLPLTFQLQPCNIAPAIAFQAIRPVDGLTEDQVEGTVLVAWPIVNVTAASVATGELALEVVGLPPQIETGTVTLRMLHSQNPQVQPHDLATADLADGLNPLWNLDDVISTSAARPDELFNSLRGRLEIQAFDVHGELEPFDVGEIRVLANRRITNYFTPTWDGIWEGQVRSKGHYPHDDFPDGLQARDFRGAFLDAQDPANGGLSMDGDVVSRPRPQPQQDGFERYIFEDGSGNRGYLENPDRWQTTAARPGVDLLRNGISVAVRPDAFHISAFGSQVYIRQFRIREVDDRGGLHGNRHQIDVYQGEGDQTLRDEVWLFAIQNWTCWHIVNPIEINGGDENE